jgi:hypothetical protein
MSPQKTELPAKALSPSPEQRSGIEFSRSEDFIESYANNVALESSLWDLKFIFGQNDQNIGPNAVVQHTAITLPWAQVKVLAYSLSLLLTDQEARSGRIQLKKGIVGELPAQMPKAVSDSGEITAETWKAMRKLYEAFSAANPEIAQK